MRIFILNVVFVVSFFSANVSFAKTFAGVEVLCSEIGEEGFETGTVWLLRQTSTRSFSIGTELPLYTDGVSLLMDRHYDWLPSPEVMATLSQYQGVLGDKPWQTIDDPNNLILQSREYEGVLHRDGPELFFSHQVIDREKEFIVLETSNLSHTLFEDGAEPGRIEYIKNRKTIPSFGGAVKCYRRIQATNGSLAH